MEIQLVYYALGICGGSLSYISSISARILSHILFGYLLCLPMFLLLAIFIISTFYSLLCLVSIVFPSLLYTGFIFLGVIDHVALASFCFLICGVEGNWLLTGLGAR